MSEHLKSIVQDIVNGRSEQALATFNKYVTSKTQQLAGLTEESAGDSKKVIKRIKSFVDMKDKPHEITDAEFKALEHSIQQKLDKGWTEDEVFKHIKNHEDVSPDLDEEEALKRMKAVSAAVEERLKKAKDVKVVKEAKWSADVETKWTPPAGLFTKSAEAIASALKRASDSHAQASSRLSFYTNRAGKNLSAEEKEKLKAASAKLKAMYAEGLDDDEADAFLLNENLQKDDILGLTKAEVSKLMKANGFKKGRIPGGNASTEAMYEGGKGRWMIDFSYGENQKAIKAKLYM